MNVRIISTHSGDFNAVLLHEGGCARECLVLPDDDLLDSELHDRARAQVAGHESRIENGVLEIPDPSGIAQAIDLGVCDRVGLLHSLIVSGGEQFSISHESGANRNSSFAAAFAGLGDGGLHKFIGCGIRHDGMLPGKIAEVKRFLLSVLRA